MDTDHIHFQNFTILQALGKGGTCQVKLGCNSSTGEFVAIKIIEPKLNNYLRIEINSLRAIPRHPNIINLISYSEGSVYRNELGEKQLVSFIVLEYCQNGDLYDLVSKFGAFPIIIARKFFKDLIGGLEAIHNAGLVHRDIKPENLLFNEQFELKIADFGFCGQSSGKITSYKGTLSYMATEILERKPYCGRSADIFAAGIILFLMMIGRPPFQTAHRNNPHYVNIVNRNWEAFWRKSLLPNKSKKLKDLIQKMIAYHPEERITLNEIKNHEWLNGPIATQDEIQEFFHSKSSQCAV